MQKGNRFLRTPYHKLDPSKQRKRFSNERTWEQYVRGWFVANRFTFIKMPASTEHLPDRYVGHGNWIELKVRHWGGDYPEQPYPNDPKKRIKDYRVKPFSGISKGQKLTMGSLVNNGDQPWVCVRLICPQGAYGCIVPYRYSQRQSMQKLFTRKDMEAHPAFWRIESRDDMKRMLETNFLPYYRKNDEYRKWEPRNA